MVTTGKDSEWNELTSCRASSLSSTSSHRLASSRRQLQHGSPALIDTTSAEAVLPCPLVTYSLAFWLCAASRCNPASLPILLACRAASAVQLPCKHDDFVTCSLYYNERSGLVQVRLESGSSDLSNDRVKAASLSLSSALQPPAFLSARQMSSHKCLASPQDCGLQSKAVTCNAHNASMQGESAYSCGTAPLVAGLWQSLPELPPCRSGAGLRAWGTAVCCEVQGTQDAPALSPKTQRHTCEPCSPKSNSSDYFCEKPRAASASGSVNENMLISGTTMDLGSGSMKHCIEGPFEMHTPQNISQAATDRHQQSVMSLELTSRSSPESEQEHGHYESCTDEHCDAVCKHAPANMTAVTAHPVCLLSEPQHVISPPLSSVDGDDGISGPLHCGITLGALDSVDEAVTDNGNNSEIDQGASDAGVLSAPASVSGMHVNATEHDQQETPKCTLYDVRVLDEQCTAVPAAAEVTAAAAEESERVAEACLQEALVLTPDEDDDVACHLALLYDDNADQEPCLLASQEWPNDHAKLAESVRSAGAMSAECLGEQDERSLQGFVEETVEQALPGSSFIDQGSFTTHSYPEGMIESISGAARLSAPDCSTNPAHTSAATCSFQSPAALEAAGGNHAVDTLFRVNKACSSTPVAPSTTLPWVLQQHPSPFKSTNARSLEHSSTSAAVDGAAAAASGCSSSAPHAAGTSSFQQHSRPMSRSMRDPTTAAAAPSLPPLPCLDFSYVAPRDDGIADFQGPMGPGYHPPAPLDSALAAGPGPSLASLVPPELPPLLPAAPAPPQQHAAHVPHSRDAVPAFLHAPHRTADLSQAGTSLIAGSSQVAVQCIAAEELCVSPTPLIAPPSAEDPPDVPILSRDSSPTLFSLLDQHLLDRIMLHVSATNSLNSAAAVCRRFRNAARRLAGSATLLPSPSCTPPIDPATGALDLHPLQNFTGLHTLRLPKFDRMRKIEVLPVELFRLRMLTQLTYLDIQCAAYVPTFQPLRLLPSLRHVSCAGASLNPAPDLPELPNCEVMLYANRGLSAATRRNVLATLPPLSGLRVPSKAPAALLQQIGSSPSMRTLTYLRLGSCQSPALDPLAPLTQLVRLHLHVVNGHVTPLTTLFMLTYLHLHGQVDDLAVALGSFRRLQKLSLIKCKRLRADEVRAVGTLAALTSLELPCSKTSSPPRDIRPLARLKNLQHLSLAMPESGIAPLTRLSALTFLRLKYRAPDTEPPAVVPRLALTASLFSVHLAISACTPAVRLLSGGGAQDSGSGSSGAGGGSSQGSLLSAAMSSVLQSTSQAALSTAVTLAGAAAVPLAAYATRRAWTAFSQTLFPPAVDAGRLSDLCHMTQLQWLEVKSSTMPTPEEWSAALRPLTCLRRLDVRNTSFRDPLALQDMPNLQVVLISGCTGLPRTNQALQEAASLREDVEIRR